MTLRALETRLSSGLDADLDLMDMWISGDIATRQGICAMIVAYISEVKRRLADRPSDGGLLGILSKLYAIGQQIERGSPAARQAKFAEEIKARREPFERAAAARAQVLKILKATFCSPIATPHAAPTTRSRADLESERRHFAIAQANLRHNHMADSVAAMSAGASSGSQGAASPASGRTPLQEQILQMTLQYNARVLQSG